MLFESAGFSWLASVSIPLTVVSPRHFEMLEVLFEFLTVDEDIIQKNGHKIVQLFFEQLILEVAGVLHSPIVSHLNS